ncbi:MAG: TMEM165/GDT1 family protein [Betaproteobacteria bacterium]
MLKTFLTTFWLVFLAELGDKTQLAIMSLAAENRTLWPVFAGAASALVLTSAIGVLAGGALTRIVPQAYIHSAAAVGFIIIGVLMLLGKF